MPDGSLRRAVSTTDERWPIIDAPGGYVSAVREDDLQVHAGAFPPARNGEKVLQDPEARIAELEAENVELRRRIADLKQIVRGGAAVILDAVDSDQ